MKNFWTFILFELTQVIWAHIIYDILRVLVQCRNQALTQGCAEHDIGIPANFLFVNSYIVANIMHIWIKVLAKIFKITSLSSLMTCENNNNMIQM
jgi:hypothetical protein